MRDSVVLPDHRTEGDVEIALHRFDRKTDTPTSTKKVAEARKGRNNVSVATAIGGVRDRVDGQPTHGAAPPREPYYTRPREGAFRVKHSDDPCSSSRDNHQIVMRIDRDAQHLIGSLAAGSVAVLQDIDAFGGELLHAVIALIRHIHVARPGVFHRDPRRVVELPFTGAGGPGRAAAGARVHAGAADIRAEHHQKMPRGVELLHTVVARVDHVHVMRHAVDGHTRRAGEREGIRWGRGCAAERARQRPVPDPRQRDRTPERQPPGEHQGEDERRISASSVARVQSTPRSLRP